MTRRDEARSEWSVTNFLRHNCEGQEEAVDVSCSTVQL